MLSFGAGAFYVMDRGNVDFESAKKYPEHLRRVRFKDPETGKTLILLFFLRIALNPAATASISTERAASRRSSSIDAFFSAATSASACPGVGMKIPSDAMSIVQPGSILR